MSLYPKICAEATASFSVLSETINAVRQILGEAPRNRKDLTVLLARLQKAEKEKLNLTAALHLEKIRAQSQEQIGQQKQEETEGAVDKRIASLLQQGVASLQQKIAKTIEEINETLEELRYALMEENE